MTPEERRHLSEEVAPIPLPYQFSGDGYERKRGDGTPDRGYNLWSGNLETGENLRMVGTVQIPKGANWGHRETLATILFISRATRAFHDLQAVLQLAEKLYNRQHANLSITTAMWRQLFGLTNKAQAALEEPDNLT